MSTSKERIEQLVKQSGLTVKDYAISIGIIPQNLYDILRGKTIGVSEKISNKIISKYPNINKVWILTGEGDMFLEQSGQSNINIHRSSLNNSPINSTATVEAFLSELGAQRRLTEKTIEQVSRSQDQIDRLITLLEQRQ